MSDTITLTFSEEELHQILEGKQFKWNYTLPKKGQEIQIIIRLEEQKDNE